MNDVSIVREEGHGNILRLTDGSGGSIGVNDSLFSGNWLTRGQDGCLCFDYRVDWSEANGSNAGSTPKLLIYAGAPLTSNTELGNRLRATFAGNSGNPLIKDNTWGKYCLPIAPCVNGQLPSNSIGQWKVAGPGDTAYLTGQAACDAWNTLIGNVSGLVLPTDYNSDPSEVVSFDNFCWKCDAQPCATIADRRITCRLDNAGRVLYDYCVTIKNISALPAYHSTGWASGGGGITVAPNPNSLSLFLNPVPPGGTVTQCYVISGAGALPGAIINLTDTINLYDLSATSADKLCVKCVVTDSIRLPNCPIPVNCCPAGFTHLFKDLKFNLTNTGTGSVNGLITAGSLPMQSVKVTLLGSYVRGAVATGRITGGTIDGTLGSLDPVHEVSFGRWAPCKDLTAAKGFSIGLQLPPYSWPPPPPGLLQTFICPERDSVCLRFQFVDCECRLCDTVICLAVTRKRAFLFDRRGLFGIRPGSTREKEDGAPVALSESGAESAIRGTLLGNDSGRLDIVFPRPLDSSTAITYVAISIAPVDSSVYITGAADGRLDFFYAAAGRAHGVFTARPNDSMKIAISYNDFGNRASIDHLITISYRIDGESFDEEIPVTFYRKDSSGGDIVMKDSKIAVDGARTIGLHLRNLNNARRPIHYLAIRVSDGMEILAVGPPAETRGALLDLGRVESRTFVGERVDGYNIQLDPGDTLTPIYITIRGGGDSTLEFSTLDANGNVITEGRLPIPSGIIDRDDDPSASGIIIKSYPNPASGTSTIDLFMPQASRSAGIAIVDAGGRVVQELLSNAQLYGGRHLILFDTSTLPSGTYFCVVRTEFGTESQTIHVVR